jgi:hypothetical protein
VKLHSFVSASCSQLGSLPSKWTGQRWGRCLVSSVGRWGSSCSRNPMLVSRLIAVRNWGGLYIKHFDVWVFSCLGWSTCWLFLCILSTKCIKWMHNEELMSVCLSACFNSENTDGIFIIYSLGVYTKSYWTNLILWWDLILVHISQI